MARDLATILQHLAPVEPDGPVVAPIAQSTTYRLDDAEEAAARAKATRPETFYGRYGSPNAAQAAQMVAAVEGGEDALVLGSGMAAVSAALLGLVRAGDHVVAQTAHYTGTLSLLSDTLPRYGVDVTQVEQTDVDAFAAAMTERTRLVYVETPTNPTLQITNLAAVAEVARSGGAVTVCDNTFASGANQPVIAHGIDVVVTSATKFLNGHHDVVAGAVVSTTQRIDELWTWQRLVGPVLHPMEAWLLARGLRTVPLRIARQNETAMALAAWLEEHPAVERVHYPGLTSHPQHGLASRQMTGGFGGMVSFELAGSADGARDRGARVLAALDLIVPAVSLGGAETLLTHPASQIYAHQTAGELEAAGISPALLRLSAGLEDPADLIDDLDRALGAD